MARVESCHAWKTHIELLIISTTDLHKRNRPNLYKYNLANAKEVGPKCELDGALEMIQDPAT